MNVLEKIPTGGCEGCKKRKKKMIKEWRKLVDRINAAADKQRNYRE